MMVALARVSISQNRFFDCFLAASNSRSRFSYS
jgi:hypothetical protein